MINRLLICLVLALTVGCAGHQKDPRLQRIAETVADSPESAIASLDSIDGSWLSESDRHFKDFLTVKALDKAYVTHTSDSLILDVIGYAKSHRKDGYYPEALYYGGRVYSDLGDLPTALRYYQDALDLVPADKENALLRTRILVQTARVLDRFRLYDEAKQMMQETLDLDNLYLPDDIKGYVYDLQSMGALCLRAQDLVSAQSYLHDAFVMSEYLPVSFQAKTMMSLAAVEMEKGNLDSALTFIRGVPDKVKPVSRATALAHASKIYLANNIIDTAMMYARELLQLNDNSTVKTAYRVLLSPQVLERLPLDSQVLYVRNYADALNAFYNENNASKVILQQSIYNYAVHDRKRDEMKSSRDMLWKILLSIVMLLMFLSIIVVYLKYKNKSLLLKLKNALDGVTELKALLEKDMPQDSLSQKFSSVVLDVSDKTKETVDDLRSRIYAEVMDLYELRHDTDTVESAILESDAYREVLEHIAHKREIKENDGLWSDLESAISLVSPLFKRNLILLTGGALTENDYHTVILIKCGIGTSNMAILLNRTKSTIVSRRESLARKVFGEKRSVKLVDGIIRCL